MAQYFQQADIEEAPQLPTDVSRYEILSLIKRLGKAVGFTPRMIQLLDHYVSFTRDIDWAEGARPVVFQSLQRTAQDLGISERQIQRVEKALSDAGAISWSSSGNHRRYGRRCSQSGRILYAFGVDLTPMAALKPLLLRRLEEKREAEKIWSETKRQISWYRAQIRSLISTATQSLSSVACEIQESTRLTRAIRSNISLESLTELKDWHRNAYLQLRQLFVADSMGITQPKAITLTPNDVENVVHKESTRKKQSDESDTCGSAIPVFRGRSFNNATQQGDSSEKPPTSSTNQYEPKTLTFEQLQAAATARFKAAMPYSGRQLKWHDFIEAAFRIRSDLMISQGTWANACSTLGREGAAICLLLTDRASLRTSDPVRRPPAYFNELITRGQHGNLNLKASIFALLKKSEHYNGQGCSATKST